MDMLSSRPDIQEALRAYGLEGAALFPVTVGHINQTFIVQHGDERLVLQRLNPIFSPAIHRDIDIITEHLQRRGVTTPRLIRNHESGLFTTTSDGGVWRVMTFLEGVVFTRAESPKVCYEAGVLVGRFHRAVANFDHVFLAPRLGVHDTPRHIENLQKALATHQEHRAYAAVEPLAQQLLQHLRGLPLSERLPSRIVHGDLKLSNLMFSAQGEGLALLDLDTLNHMPWPIELGDAFRSWCALGGEDSASAHFSLAYFDAALAGYAQGGPKLEAVEIEAIVDCIALITLELGVRFACDSLEETYFGWDKGRFSSASEHNLARARGQLSLAESIGEQKSKLAQVVSQRLSQS